MSEIIALGLHEEQMPEESWLKARFYLRQRPVMLAMLSFLLVLFFLFVTGLSRLYHAQRESLGQRWFTRGVGDLKAKNFAGAVTEFRTALLYSRDNYSYQLDLAEALLGLKRTGEASAYLLNLWDREPDDGLVNLELARIAAQQRQSENAIRFYHDAIYAAWTNDEEGMRRDARFELIEFLLRINAKAQAEAELIALAANVGDDPILQERIGDLFLRAQDYEHALAAFHLTLRADRRNQGALAGAGESAFELGKYSQAQRYLQAAVTEDPKDLQSADRLTTTEMVLKMDPFQRQISAAERNRIVLEAFATAGQRLKNCAVPKIAVAGPAGVQPGVGESWAALKARITEEGLRRNPDLVESAMDVVFRIERQTETLCGMPSGPDLALLLISKLHEGT